MFIANKNNCLLLISGTLLSKQVMYNSIRKSITLMFLEEEIHAFVDNVGAHAGGHKRGVSIQISIYLGKTFLGYLVIRNISLT